MSSTNTQLSLMSLYEVGAQRGNHKSRINPKLKSQVHKIDNNSLCIIDLTNTLNSLANATKLMYNVGKKRKQVLIVGTSKYISEYTVKFANMFATPMPYVHYRWLGGQLTNWQTIRKTLKEIDKLESIVNNVDFFAKLSRNEQLSKTREYQKKMNLFAGIRNLKNSFPGVVIVLDPKKNKTAILEAETNKVPLICFTNLNTVLLPQDLSTTVTFNNTSLNAVDLLSGKLLESYNQGAADALALTEARDKDQKDKPKTTFRPRVN